jgi:hypothetical protein
MLQDNQGILETQILALELSLSVYDTEVTSLNNDAQIEDILEIKPESIITQTPEQNDIITNFSEVVDSVSPCK